MVKTVNLEPVTRIEGHARISLDMDDGGGVEAGRLHVLEIRGFEKLLERMELTKMPTVTARICGVCPAAHHLASVTAIENGLGIQPPPRAVLLRNLMYMGHVLHSHALSTFVLVGPDILCGIKGASEKNIFALLRSEPELAKKALRLRSIGQRIVEIVGGRGVHPVSGVAGGVAAAPSAEEIAKMAEWGDEALGLLEETRAPLVKALEGLGELRENASLEPFSRLALSNDGVVDFLRGTVRVAGTDGTVKEEFPAQEYASRLIEHAMPGSYMKSVRLRGEPEERFFVGPLARLSVNQRFSSPRATELLEAFVKDGLRCSAVDNIQARMIEMVHCAERIKQLCSEIPADGELRTEAAPRKGRYVGVVEAPRGILVHDYTADEDGRVAEANLIVATQNNYDAINAAITSLARYYVPQGDDSLTMGGAEFALRCFDPCLACATHVAGRMPLKVEFRHRGRVLRTITRGSQP